MSLLPSSPDVSPDSDPRLVGLDSEEADELMAALSSETARQLLAELHDEPAPPGELAGRVDTSLQNAQYHLEKLEGAGAIEVVGTAYSEKGREMAVYGPADSPLVIYAGEQERTSGLRAALTRLFTGITALAVGSLAIQELFGRSVIQRVIEGATPSMSGAPPTETPGGGGPTDTSERAGNGAADGAGGNGADTTTVAEPTPTPADDADAPVNETVGQEATPEPTGTPFETETPVSDAATPTDTPAPADTPVPTETPVRTVTEGGGGDPFGFLDGLLDGLLGGGLPPGLAFFIGGLTVLAVVVATTYVRAQP